MPNLGDLVGHLLSEIVIGRTQADAESLRIAELYANHPLLRHLTVPRFRLPNVTLDVPFAISNIGEIVEGKEPRGKLAKTPALFKRLEETIRVNFAKTEGLAEGEFPELREKIEEKLDEMTRIKEVPIGMTNIADELALEAIKLAVSKNVRFKPESEHATRLRERLKSSIRLDLLSFMEKPARLKVLATAKDLEAIKDPNAIVHLHLTISEEGIEWTTIDTQDRLVEE